MEKSIIARGLLLGALGGLVAFVFARIFSEPVIGRAIDYEAGRDDAQSALDRAAGIPVDMHEHEVFTRGIQSNVGIGFGVVLFGIAMGALFAVVYSVAAGRVGRLTSRNLALAVAGGLFLVLYAVPALKYPANPPSIGHSETIGSRTGLYLTMVVTTAVFAVLAILLGRRLQARWGTWTAVLASAAAFAVAVGVVMLLLPSLGELAANQQYGDFATETPQPLTDPAGKIVYPGFPADDLYAFRLYSMLTQAIVWTVIGVGFAWLAPRLLDGAPARARGTATVS